LVGSSSSGIGALGIAALGVEFAVHDPRQSGLPGPVRAARCDAFRSADGQVDALAEQVAFAQAFAEEQCPSRRHRGLGEFQADLLVLAQRPLGLVELGCQKRHHCRTYRAVLVSSTCGE
jgi:hypothetical protein